jgi:hypothetical protein
MTKKCFLILPALLLCLGVTGCKEKDKKEETANLTGTRWKLVGFVENGKLIEAEPKDCAECYALTFNIDRTLGTHSSTNGLFGTYSIDNNLSTIEITNLGGTKINELLDGKLYVETLLLIQSFSIVNNELKLYYANNKNYLLFKPLKQ